MKLAIKIKLAWKPDILDQIGLVFFLSVPGVKQMQTSLKQSTVVPEMY